MFTTEELKNISALINIAPIKGQEAMTVALLQQKIGSLLTPGSNVDPKPDTHVPNDAEIPSTESFRGMRTKKN